jgi:hypothetical protein
MSGQYHAPASRPRLDRRLPPPSGSSPRVVASPDPVRAHPGGLLTVHPHRNGTDNGTGTVVRWRQRDLLYDPTTKATGPEPIVLRPVPRWRPQGRTKQLLQPQRPRENAHRPMLRSLRETVVRRVPGRGRHRRGVGTESDAGTRRACWSESNTDTTSSHSHGHGFPGPPASGRTRECCRSAITASTSSRASKFSSTSKRPRVSWRPCYRLAGSLPREGRWGFGQLRTAPPTLSTVDAAPTLATELWRGKRLSLLRLDHGGGCAFGKDGTLVHEQSDQRVARRDGVKQLTILG